MDCAIARIPPRGRTLRRQHRHGCFRTDERLGLDAALVSHPVSRDARARYDDGRTRTSASCKSKSGKWRGCVVKAQAINSVFTIHARQSAEPTPSVILLLSYAVIQRDPVFIALQIYQVGAMLLICVLSRRFRGSLFEIHGGTNESTT